MNYENTPLNNGRFYSEQLPEDYRVKNVQRGKAHIVRGWDGDLDYYMSLCGLVVKRDTFEEVLPAHLMCKSCMKSLNNDMEGHFFRR